MDQLKYAPVPAEASPTAEGGQGSFALIIGVGVVAGIVVVVGTLAAVTLLLFHHRRVQRERALAERERRRAAANELVEGDPGPVRIPIIVVLPDNKFHFAWEVSPEDDSGCGLETCSSCSIKSSIGDDDAEGSQAGGSSSSPPPRRFRPPLVRASIYVNPADDKV